MINAVFAVDFEFFSMPKQLDLWSGYAGILALAEKVFTEEIPCMKIAVQSAC